MDGFGPLSQSEEGPSSHSPFAKVFPDRDPPPRRVESRFAVSDNVKGDLSADKLP